MSFKRHSIALFFTKALWPQTVARQVASWYTMSTMVAKAKKSRVISNKKSTPTKRSKKVIPLPFYLRIQEFITSKCLGVVKRGSAIVGRIRERNRRFLARRPHRSFRLTRRRDYVRSLNIGGYVSFVFHVNKVLRQYWRMFALLVFIYATILILLGAITSQTTYVSINELLKGVTGDFFGKGIGQVGQAGLVALSAFASSTSKLTPENNVYLVTSLIFAWLATVWLLREILLGHKPKLRDGLYNSGAPVLATLGVVLVLIIQLLPIGVVALVFGALSSLGIIDGGFGSMLFWLAATVIVTMVLYWITSTIIALVVVTLPGMYPLRATKLASDLVIGRRLRIMLRLLWGFIAIVLFCAVIIVIAILLNNWIGLLLPVVEFLPIVPYIGAIVTAYAVVWYAAYVYLFYRKVVDDDAKPA